MYDPMYNLSTFLLNHIRVKFRDSTLPIYMNTSQLLL
uniref:Uncharacterized protein n=1 Tax=Lepeophtheirus salmonis TaxID=72036 RepID=A0A0K2V6I6_LEPSM